MQPSTPALHHKRNGPLICRGHFPHCDSPPFAHSRYYRIETAGLSLRNMSSRTHHIQVMQPCCSFPRPLCNVIVHACARPPEPTLFASVDWISAAGRLRCVLTLAPLSSRLVVLQLLYLVIIDSHNPCQGRLGLMERQQTYVAY
jgi:hypothetical protein